MKKIILDTDFLVHCAENRVDYVTEMERICNFKYQLYVIDKTMDELDRIIEKKKQKARLAAKLAKIILKAKKIPEIKTKKDKTTDELMLENLDKDTIIATMDANLKRILKKKSVPVVILRQRKYLKILYS